MAAGRPHSIYFLGYMYYTGKCVEQDYIEAVKWLYKAAEAGDKDGMYYLGDAHENGNGAERDQKKAREWYERASRLGHKKAEKAVKRLRRGLNGTAPLD